MENELLYPALLKISSTAKPAKTPFDETHLEYKDDKITISALMTGSLPNLKLRHIEVYIHFIHDIGGSGVIDIKSVQAHEYDASQGITYHRHGKWVDYAINLAAKIEKERTELNNTPIDDSTVFPDL